MVLVLCLGGGGLVVVCGDGRGEYLVSFGGGVVVGMEDGVVVLVLCFWGGWWWWWWWWCVGMEEGGLLGVI